VPNLLALQTESFDRLIGNDLWKARLAKAEAAGDTSVPAVSGLAEIFEEISPIEDFQDTMSLSFSAAGRSPVVASFARFTSRRFFRLICGRIAQPGTVVR
jgi:DNA-directed RNA polymerase beta subunit